MLSNVLILIQYDTVHYVHYVHFNVSTNVILPSAHLARVANMPLDYLDEEQAEAWFSWIFNFKDLKVLKHPTYLMFNDVHTFHRSSETSLSFSPPSKEHA